MSNSQVKTKPVSKTTLCYSIFRQVVTNKEQLSNKEQLREIRSTLKTRFMTEVGVTEKGVNPYIQICVDRFLGIDPHKCRKTANKNRSAKQKSQLLTSKVLALLGFNPNLLLPLL